MTIATSAPGMRSSATARMSASMFDPRPEIRMPILFIASVEYETYETYRTHKSHKSHSRSLLISLKIRFKQLQNSLVFVGPARGALKPMIFDGIYGQLPILFPQFDQALDQPHRVLEMHVDVDHAKADQQRAFQPLREIDRRALLVGFGVVLRDVKNIRRVAVIVMRPIGDGPQGGSGGEDVRLGEHRHQRDEAAIAAAVKAHVFGVDAVLRHQIFHGVNMIAQILAAHVPIDSRTPVATVTG